MIDDLRNLTDQELLDAYSALTDTRTPDYRAEAVYEAEMERRTDEVDNSPAQALARLIQDAETRQEITRLKARIAALETEILRIEAIYLDIHNHNAADLLWELKNLFTLVENSEHTRREKAKGTDDDHP